MRGSRDRTDQVGQPEPSRWSVAELQQRLERLPPGHPSSPYNGDGSRKPPVPRLRDLELPLPAEENTEEPDRPGGDDGTWHWKGLTLTPDQNRRTGIAHDHLTALEGRDVDGQYGEHGLTPAMRRIEAGLEHGHLQGCPEYSLKGVDRFKEKVARLLADEPGSEVSEVIGQINDGVRYTFVFADAAYATGVVGTSEQVAAAGFEPVERKNAWADETKAYQGINSTWRDAGSGLLFEVQFHTPQSWAAKQASHGAYEVQEARDSSPAERARAESVQKQIFASVPVPDGALAIPSYRKEGW